MRDTGRHTPWMARVAPEAVRLVEAHRERTIFTRSIPAARPGDEQGTWKRCHQRWAEAHDASVTLYLKRYDHQVEVATVEQILAGWR